MLVHFIAAVLAAPLTLASPTPSIETRQSTPDAVLKVTKFTAFMANPEVEGALSNMSFHVVDSRPDYYAEVDCIVPNTIFNLYAISALFDIWGCAQGMNRTLDFAYAYRETGLTIRRGWRANETSYVTGSSTQSTNWVEQGSGANVTIYPDGKLYRRESEWLFPIPRVTAGTPP